MGRANVVTFGSKITGYHDLRVFFRTLPRSAFDYAPIRLLLLDSDSQSMVLSALVTPRDPLGFYLPYPKRFRLLTPAVDLPKIWYEC